MAYVGIGADGRPTDPLKVSERYHPSLDDPGIDPETGRTIAWIGWACDSPRANKSLLPAGRCYLPPDVYRRLPAVVTAMAVDRDSGDPGMRPTISYPSVAEAYADLRAAMASAAPPADPIDPTAVLTSPTPPPAERVPTGAATRATRPALDGLTVRDHFASAALQGILAAHSGGVDLPDPAKAAKWAQQYADALLTRLADHSYT